MEISNLRPSCQLAHKDCVLSFWIRVPYTQLRRHERMNGRRHKSTPAARFHPHSPLVRHERREGGRKKKKTTKSWIMNWNRGRHRVSAVSLIREVKGVGKTEGTKNIKGLLSDGKGGGTWSFCDRISARSTQPQECTAAARANWGLSTAGELESTLRRASPQNEELWPYKGTLDLRFRFFPLEKNHPVGVSLN